MTIDNKIAVIAILAPILTGFGAYAMDWQLKQDQKINDLDKLIDRQSTLLEMQIRFNEELGRKEQMRAPASTGDNPPERNDLFNFLTK